MVSPSILLRFDADADADNIDVVYLEYDTAAFYLERPADIKRTRGSSPRPGNWPSTGRRRGANRYQ